MPDAGSARWRWLRCWRRAPTNPLAPKPPHFPARAKAVIHLFMHGGVSHVDTFDPKPELAEAQRPNHLRRDGEGAEDQPHRFRQGADARQSVEVLQHGQSGMEISELFPGIASKADEIALIRSCYGDAFDHAPGMYLRHSGSQFPGRPSLGSWVAYGLGSENQNLPALCGDVGWRDEVGTRRVQRRLPAGGLSGHRVSQRPVSRAEPGESERRDRKAQRNSLDLIAELNQQHLDKPSGRLGAGGAHRVLRAGVSDAELGARSGGSRARRSEATKKLYGIGEQLTDDFGRKCLLARRLVERGVRFIQLYSGTNIGEDWDDAHTDLQASHTKMCKKTDQPITALLTDLKARGMLDSTLVVWNSEFGRTPLAEGTKGRDHHPYVFSMWMAGAGIQGGQVLGSSDEFGLRPLEIAVQRS